MPQQKVVSRGVSAGRRAANAAPLQRAEQRQIPNDVERGADIAAVAAAGPAAAAEGEPRNHGRGEQTRAAAELGDSNETRR